jgi:hypothetical protein
VACSGCRMSRAFQGANNVTHSVTTSIQYENPHGAHTQQQAPHHAMPEPNHNALTHTPMHASSLWHHPQTTTVAMHPRPLLLGVV